jgi:hypothetical protein
MVYGAFFVAEPDPFYCDIDFSHISNVFYKPYEVGWLIRDEIQWFGQLQIYFCKNY